MVGAVSFVRKKSVQNTTSVVECVREEVVVHVVNCLEQVAFEKCWAHSPLPAAPRCIAIHQVSPLSHAACASMSTTTTTTTTTTRDRGDRYCSIEWAQ